MESGPLTAHAARRDVLAESAAPLRRGRFSTGIEQLAESPAKQRVGRFCDGIARVPECASERRVGRFSAGMEQAETANTRREGSFADGYRPSGRQQR